MIGCSECPRSQWLISKSRTLEFSVLVLGRKMKLNQREVKRNSFGCGSPFALLWTPICHTRTLYQLLIQDTLKKMFSSIKICCKIWLSYRSVIIVFSFFFRLILNRSVKKERKYQEKHQERHSSAY